jgi:hypothetical protein
MTATLEELTSRVQAIDGQISQLDVEFADAAASFDSGNSSTALKRAEAIEQRIHSLRREKAVCLAAAGQVAQRRLQEQSEAAAAEQRKLQIAARTHADAICSLNLDIDRQFAALVTLLSQRAAACRTLANTGVVQDTLTNKLQSKNAITAAACHAGLHRQIDIHTVSNASVRPLADGNRILLGVGIGTAGRTSQASKR